MNLQTPTYNTLVNKLKRYYRQKSTIAVLSGLLRFFSYALPLVLLFSLIELLFTLPSSGRIVSLTLLILSLFALFIYHVGAVLFRVWRQSKTAMLSTAIEVGAHYQDINDRLANALQLYQNHERDKARYSIHLMEAALSQVADELKEEYFTRHLNRKPLLRSLRSVAIVGGLFAVIWFGLGEQFTPAFARLTHPRQSFQDIQPVNFVVLPGDTRVLKGDDVHLRVWLSDSTITQSTLTLKNQAASQQIELQKTTDDTFRHTIAEVRDTLVYSIRAAQQKTPQYRITITERPLLRTLNLKVTPPRYANMDAYFLDDNIGDVSALKGTRVDVSGFANKSLSSGFLQFSDSTQAPLTVNNRNVESQFTIKNDDTYSIHLVDEMNVANVSPIEYKIRIIPDNHPFVRIVVPGKDVDLGDDMVLPLAIEAQDDFGLSKLQLAYQILPAGEAELDSSRFVFQDIQGFEKNEDQLKIALQWELEQLEMYPTDVLVYYVEAYDNDQVSGPKNSKSEMYRARFPSLYEMYQDVASEQDEATETVSGALEKSRDLKQKIDELSLEMKRNLEMDWQQSQEVQEAMKKQQQIQEELQQASQQLDEMMEKIEKNELFSRETIQKLQEIQELYKDIMTPELQEAMENMNEALQNLDDQMVQQAMEQLQLNMEEYNKTLDRTLSLLKKLKAEQKLQQAQKLAQDLAERQADITEQSQKQDADNTRLEREQQQISQNTEALSEVLDDLQQELSDIPNAPQEQVNAAQEQMQNDNLQNRLQELQAMMQQNQMQQVPEQSSQAQQSFEKMASNLQDAQNIMSGQMQQQAMQAMRKSSREMLQLSKQQEELMQQSEGMPRNSTQFPQTAEQQQDIASGLKRVYDEMTDVMKKNFGIDPRISKSIGTALSEMEESISALEERNSQRAAESQGSSMSAMNEAVRQMQSSMQSMMQGSGSGSMSYQQFLQQMQQMGESQGQLNQQTQNMGMGPPMSMGQQAAMSRLAAEQRQLRKSMEQLAREAGGMSEVLGSLEKIADDMEKVEQDFENRQITRETIQRQNRILSRMLDAQKSVHQREYSRQRQAETGKTYVTTSPDELPDDLGERRDQLQQDLLRAKKEGYSRDYLNIIENYFKALTNEASESQ
mgnify:CR=1 FL=1